MKKSTKKTLKMLGVIVFTATMSLQIQAQAPTIQWQKSFGGTSYDGAFSCTKTTDGGYLTMGMTMSSDGDSVGNHGNVDVLAVKTDASGVVQWKNVYGGSNSEQYASNCLAQCTDGGYIFCAKTMSNDGDVTGLHGADYDVWVVKINATGSIEWQKALGGTAYDDVSSVIQTADGGFIVAAYALSNNGNVIGNHGSLDAWMIKLNATGLIEWRKCYGGTGQDAANAVLQLSDGSYIVAGYTESADGDVTSNHGAGDAWLMKISATGVLQWQKNYGGTSQDGFYDIKKSADGGFILTGFTGSIDGDVIINQGAVDIWVVKTDAIGSIQWQKTYGGTGNEQAFNINITTDNEYIIAGVTNSTDGDISSNHGGFDAWILKLHSDGTLKWQKAYGSTSDEGSYGIVQTTDGGYYFVADSYGNDNDVNPDTYQGLDDFWCVKLEADPLSVTSFDSQLMQIQPNPATSQFTLQLDNSVILDKVSIIDLTGKTVLETKTSCKTVNIEKLASGVYIVQAISKQKTFQSKLVKQ